ncbi:hypothetical protein DL769_008026 [Monosporascus sp. CRB-8-3]|nr:hypothetical protein DL769_008026 [Monosporascus sp. CRB-8-3]
MGSSGKYHGGHGGGGKDLPPLSQIDSCSNAGPGKIRYGETHLPKMLTRARNMSPLEAKRAEAEKLKPLEPPFRPSTSAMMCRGEFVKSTIACPGRDGIHAGKIEQTPGDTGKLPFTPKPLAEKNA